MSGRAGRLISGLAMRGRQAAYVHVLDLGHPRALGPHKGACPPEPSPHVPAPE